jgi:hypothetical protein
VARIHVAIIFMELGFIDELAHKAILEHIENF